MKIRAMVIIFTSLLSAQELSDYEVLDIEINENLIVVGSKSGVNWKNKDNDKWDSKKCSPFGAEIGANLDNIILGENGFAVRLKPEKQDEIAILRYQSGKDTVLKYKFTDAKPQLFGYDGYFDVFGWYIFAMGDGGAAFVGSDTLKIGGAGICVNSVIDYEGYSTALLPDGKIMRYSGTVWVKIDSLKLQPNEYAVKFIKGSKDFPFFILTTDTTAVDKEKLYRKNKETYDLIYSGGISKAALTPDDFIYIINNDGALVVCYADGKRTPDVQSLLRHDILLRRIAKANVPTDYKLTDISIYSDTSTSGEKIRYSIGFASNKGVIYSKDEVNGIRDETLFEYFSKEVKIKEGLKQVYAEPGIINYMHNTCTFEYSLLQDDRVTIDILNYNLDFVCRIVYNAQRFRAVGSAHSTDRAVDKWDGTVNNNGGKSVPPGVYYFKITTEKGQRAVGKVVMAR